MNPGTEDFQTNPAAGLSPHGESRLVLCRKKPVRKKICVLRKNVIPSQTGLRKNVIPSQKGCPDIIWKLHTAPKRMSTAEYRRQLLP